MLKHSRDFNLTREAVLAKLGEPFVQQSIAAYDKRVAEDQAFEVLRQVGLAVEVVDQATLPRRREIERGDQRGEQRDVAGFHVGGRQAIARGCLEPQCEHFRIGGRRVGTAETLDTALQEFSAFSGTVPEDRAEVAVARRLARERGGKEVARDRDGQIGPQAELGAAGRGGEEHAAADILARQVEKRFGWLQDWRRHARIAGALIGREQRFRSRVRCGARAAYWPIPVHLVRRPNRGAAL